MCYGRISSLPTTTHYVAMTWFGYTLAINLMEAPVKFQAPSLTRAVGLDVGRHVFSALNKVCRLLPVDPLLKTLQPFVENNWTQPR